MRAEQLQGASDAAGSTTALLGIGLEFWEQGLTQIPVSKALESQCLVNRIIGNLKSPKSQKSGSGKLNSWEHQHSETLSRVCSRRRWPWRPIFQRLGAVASLHTPKNVSRSSGRVSSDRVP